MEQPVVSLSGDAIEIFMSDCGWNITPEHLEKISVLVEDAMQLTLERGEPIHGFGHIMLQLKKGLALEKECYVAAFIFGYVEGMMEPHKLSGIPKIKILKSKEEMERLLRVGKGIIKRKNGYLEQSND